MQKKLIALAIAAAFSAPAFADVTTYGVVDAAIVHASNTGEKSDMQAVSGGLAASRIGFKAVEDLNNGMKAVVVLEYGIDGETGSGLSAAAARQQILAIAGDFGTFATGYAQTTGYDWAVKFDPTAGSAVSPLQSMTMGGTGTATLSKFLIGSKTSAARAPRALAYISPDMGGVTVAVNYSTDIGLLSTLNGGLGNLGYPTTLGDVKVSAMLLSATYTGGPLSIGGVYLSASVPDTTAAPKPSEMALGASYDLGVAKLFATYQTAKGDANGGSLAKASSKAMSFSVVAPVGPGAVAFSYAKASVGDKTAANQDGNGMTVAWLQGLSKTTTLYAALEKVSNSSTGTNYSVLNNGLATYQAAGASSTAIALGLNKKF